MIVSKESESLNRKDGGPVADEKTTEPQHVLENEIMIAVGVKSPSVTLL
jgi:hypothetical protein